MNMQNLARARLISGLAMFCGALGLLISWMANGITADLVVFFAVFFLNLIDGLFHSQLLLGILETLETRNSLAEGLLRAYKGRLTMGPWWLWAGLALFSVAVSVAFVIQNTPLTLILFMLWYAVWCVCQIPLGIIQKVP